MAGRRRFVPLPLVAREALFTAFAVAVLFTVVVWMVFCQEWSDMRWAHRQRKMHGGGGGGGAHKSRYESLADVALDSFSYTWQRQISDMIVKTAMATAFFGCLAMARGWRARVIMTRRVAWIMAILYGIRSVTISITTMPPPAADCKPNLAGSTRELLLSVIPSMLTGETIACTDMIFSGHTTLLVASFLLWTRYARHWGFVAYSGMHTVIGIASVVMARLHYSVDILLAVAVVFFVFNLYFLSLEAAVRRRVAAGSPALADCVVLGYAPAATSSDDSIAELEKRLDAAPVHDIDAPQLLTNRIPTFFLPDIVAWMDGLWMR
ncbi:hypothetical protein H4R18_004549 [Coemansia javaensis]|uniref:Sphingomyelin synthase-like domain-containing protein n=1 Tax=Coemansia javaensis TaxID=2761396 RepID=A0A9W8H8Q2_9FUNG|nr:hypothetical protein H4R18_004549 [Coemansia javaensis]